MGDREEVLRGNVTAGVVRVGDTVRRPVGPWTETVDLLLDHLHAVGFTACPRPLGRDEQGRQVLEYVPGEMGAESGTYPTTELRSIGQLLAHLHEALASFVPPLGRRARAMYDLLRAGAREQREPWARIWTEDGPYWLATADYLDAHRDAWRAGLQ